MSDSAVALQPEVQQELANASDSLPAKAAALNVIDQVSLDMAGQALRDIKEMREKIAETFDPIVAAAFKAHRVACEQRNQFDTPLKLADTVIRGKVTGFHIEAERRRKAQEALEAAAAAEQQKQADAAAQEYEEAGEPELADAVRQEAAVTSVPTVVAPPMATKGVSVRPVWKAEVVDFMALVKAVAEGKAPPKLLLPNEKVLGELARSLQGDLDVPGVKVTESKGLAVR